ncbi:MAG: hypothetical protein RXO28_02500 [Thermocladium sp.]
MRPSSQFNYRRMASNSFYDEPNHCNNNAIDALKCIINALAATSLVLFFPDAEPILMSFPRLWASLNGGD